MNDLLISLIVFAVIFGGALFGVVLRPLLSESHLQPDSKDVVKMATGRPLWNAANIYAPTLVIAGQYDTWSYPEDREGLMRDLVHAPVKQSALIPDATHFVLFEKNRFQFFDAILKFLKE